MARREFPADRMMALGMLISAADIVGLTAVSSLCLYTPLFLVTGVGLGLAWALMQVATQAIAWPSMITVATWLPRATCRRG